MIAGLADFFKYNLWANLHILDICANLDDTQLDATLEGTYGSVRETLIHILASEEGYVHRFTGTGPEPPLYKLDTFPSFDELRRRARLSGEGLISIAEQYNPEHVLHLSYQEQLYDVPAILVLIQASTHAADHRSQIATLLSRQGVKLPELDGWSYYHEVVRSGEAPSSR